MNDSPNFYEELDQYFQNQKLEISFLEYLSLIRSAPHLHLRDGKQLVRDALKEGGYSVWGMGNKSYFRSPAFDDKEFQVVSHDRELDELFREIDRIAKGTSKENKIIAFMGPNQIGKSLIFHAIAKALAKYCADPKNIFLGVPVFVLDRSTGVLGFNEPSVDDHDEMPNRMVKRICPAKCHPLWIYPIEIRRKFLEQCLLDNPQFRLSEYLTEGQLCRSCEEHLRLKFEEKKEGLDKNSSKSLFERVIEDLRVSRIIHNRLRKEGIVFQGPEIVNDGLEAISLQNPRSLNLNRSNSNFSYVYRGPLLGAIRGILFQDEFLKKGIEYLKPYLQILDEGQISTPYENIPCDFLTLAADNLESLESFRQQHYTFYPYFKARIKIIFMGHLLFPEEEKKLYEKDIQNYQNQGIRFMKYSIEAMTMFLVMTRMKACNRNNYDRIKERELFDVVEKITLLDKYELYKMGQVTRDIFSEKEKKLIQENIYRIADEYKGLFAEGMFGPNFEEGRAFLELMIRIAKNTEPKNVVSFEDVVRAFDELLVQDSKYHFVRENKAFASTSEFSRLGLFRYDDRKVFHEPVRQKILSWIRSDLEQGFSLVDYDEILRKWVEYLKNIQAFALKKDRIRNSRGSFSDLNLDLVREIEEKRLKLPGKEDSKLAWISEEVHQHRMRLLGGQLNSWIEQNPSKNPQEYYRDIYREYLDTIYQSYHQENKQVVSQLLEQIQKYNSSEQIFFGKEQRSIQGVFSRLNDLGYLDQDILWIVQIVQKN